MVTNSSKTRAWSPSIQESGLKADKDLKMAAGKENPFGDKPIGDVLNEIADPNWIDPKKVTPERKQDLDKDAFFKLMLTQMKNQDPTNPLQSHEMAAQLAQFTSLEQLFNINSSLGDIKKGQAPMADYQVLQFIGKSIAADSSKVVRNKGDKNHELRFNLKGDAATAEVSIKDADGNVVRKLTLNKLKRGDNKVTWNGVDKDSQVMRAGDYHFVVEAKNDAGKKIGVDTEVKGRITGVNYTSRGPVLLIGEQSIYLQDVKKIEDPDMKAEENLKKQSQMILPGQTGRPGQSGQMGPAQMMPVEADDKVEGAPPETTGRSNLESVAMSGAIKDMVQKASGTP